MHTRAYLPDKARVAVGLLDHTALPTLAGIPFSGRVFSMTDLAARVARLTGRPARVSRFPVWVLTAPSPFWELARELREMLYPLEHPHMTEGKTLANPAPGFQAAPLDQVIARHLQALAKNASKIDSNPDRPVA